MGRLAKLFRKSKTVGARETESPSWSKAGLQSFAKKFATTNSINVQKLKYNKKTSGLIRSTKGEIEFCKFFRQNRSSSSSWYSQDEEDNGEQPLLAALEEIDSVLRPFDCDERVEINSEVEILHGNSITPTEEIDFSEKRVKENEVVQQEQTTSEPVLDVPFIPIALSLAPKLNETTEENKSLELPQLFTIDDEDNGCTVEAKKEKKESWTDKIGCFSIMIQTLNWIKTLTGNM